MFQVAKIIRDQVDVNAEGHNCAHRCQASEHHRAPKYRVTSDDLTVLKKVKVEHVCRHRRKAVRDVVQKTQKNFVVAKTNALASPRAVVVHSRDTVATLGAVVRAGRSYQLTVRAYFPKD